MPAERSAPFRIGLPGTVTDSAHQVAGRMLGLVAPIRRVAARALRRARQGKRLAPQSACV